MASGSRLIQCPSRLRIRERLMELANISRQEMLAQLPQDSQVCLALDCWTSSSQQAFLAITGYFIDANWRRHEFLVSFDPITGSHEGRNLANIVIQALIRDNLSRRILAVTTDNASNNGTLMDALMVSLQQELHERSRISAEAFDPILRNLLATQYHIPCLAHVIQLAVNALLKKLRLDAKNEQVERTWNNDVDSPLTSSGGIARALEKVCSNNLTWLDFELNSNVF
jgi:hypothetical protein